MITNFNVLPISSCSMADQSKCRASYREKENFCQYSFDSEGPYWHLYTPGKETGLIFKKAEDYIFAMNNLALSALKFPKLHIITFAIMDNHVHILISGERDEILRFFDYFRRRLHRGLENGVPKEFVPLMKQVDDLKMQRNVIAYINRNGYAPNPEFTPFSYLWGANSCYFNISICGRSVAELSYKDRRKMFRADSVDLPENWYFYDGLVLPSSYCAVKFGMAMFRDAHHYFSMLYKNVEAYQGVAVEIEDGEFMSDAELSDKVWHIMTNQYKIGSFKDLTGAQKIELAEMLHYEYRSSNGQIRRVLYMTPFEVNSLFPLSK